MKLFTLISCLFFAQNSAFATSQTPLAYCTSGSTSVAIVSDSADGNRLGLVYKVVEADRVLAETHLSVDSVVKNAAQTTYTTTFMDLSISNSKASDGYAGTLVMKVRNSELASTLICSLAK